MNLLIAKSGQQALNIFRSNHSIDLILMDIRLPDINGITVTRTIKQEKPSIIVIAQTAYAAASDMIACKNAGCNEYISKPINAAKMISLINKYLN